MVQDAGDIYDGLRAIIHRWNATVSGAVPDLLQDVQVVEDDLRILSQTLTMRSDVTLPLLLARAQLDAVNQTEAARQGAAQKLGGQIEQLHDALGNFEIEAHTLAAQAQRARQAAQTLAACLGNLNGAQPGRVEAAPDRDHVQRELRRQIAELQQQLAEAASRPVPQPEPRIPQDVADELARLRAEVDTLRRQDMEFESFATSLDENQQSRLRAVAQREDGKRRRMGQILVDAGIITEQQLEIALNEQRSSWSRHLGAILVQLGFATEETIAQTLAAQLHLPFVNIRYEDIDTDTLALVSQNLARLHTCIPLNATGKDLTIVMANPLDIVALDDLRLATNRTVQVCVGAATEIKAAIDRHYSRLARV
ncbi:MAG: hypothetical protein IT368_01460 [Candidatus Hydrogenedentes bacterium]|nr:hypothetical protein [Candidatus Hydrogenedentota bacterium]